ncbi:MAG: type II secretion system F family protein [Ruminiclostridium sp.]|nr:type II secretion system F family protein [Ruminiclostridium sp.]
MTTFSYVATDVNGKKLKGKESAEDAAELIDKLRQKGLYCTSYKDLTAGKANDVKFKFKTKDLSFFCRQLAAMLTSGVSLVKSLHILQSQTENKKMKAVLLDIYEEVQKGRSFSEAIATKPGVFPGLFVSMVGAGEASGNLDMIMNRVSEHYAKDSKTQNKIKGAMIYPIVLLTLLVVMMVAMFTFIMPMFRGLMMEGDEIPPLSAAMFAISDFFINQWYILIIALIAIVIAFRIILTTPASKLKWDEMLLRLPKVGGLLRTIYTARFARTMSNLFASGLQMVDCIEKSVGTLGNTYIIKSFEDVVENVKRGEALSVAIGRINVFEGMFVSIVYVGEESGTLDQILEKSSDYYDDEADSAISSMVSLLEPVMIILMGVMVGCILAGVFPILYGGMEGMGAM